jgi:hypothetical protein
MQIHVFPRDVSTPHNALLTTSPSCNRHSCMNSVILQRLSDTHPASHRHDCVIDVRSPAEFADDHLPGGGCFCPSFYNHLAVIS